MSKYLKPALLITGALGGLLAFEYGVLRFIQQSRLHPSEQQIYIWDKLGFAILLALVILAAGKWRAWGFAGGLQWRRFGLLWPLWLLAFISTVQATSTLTPLRVAGWLVISLSISFGEEGIFRGIVIGALDHASPRVAAIISAALFGAVHLANLAAPLDARVVMGQAATAGALGLILASTRLLTGSIWPGFVAHAALDFCSLAVADSVVGAMPSSTAEYIYLAFSAAAAFVWGVALWLRLPKR